MTEKQLQEAVTSLARLLRWRVYHTRDSRGSTAGFPDLVLLRAPRLIFAELKSADGRVRPEQEEWLGELRRMPGVTAVLWRPADWTCGVVEAVLR